MEPAATVAVGEDPELRNQLSTRLGRGRAKRVFKLVSRQRSRGKP